MTTTEGFQMSPQQIRQWRLERASGSASGQCALELRGALDAGRLERALAQVVARHEILRTSFPVPPYLQIPLQVIAEEGEAVWQACLVRREPDLHDLTLTLPVLCADGHSLLNIAAEIGLAYAGEELDPDPLQYADYAAWRHELLEDGEAAAGRQHWQGCDLAALDGLRLPFEGQAASPFEPAAHAEVWPAPMWKGIEAASRAAGAGPATWLLALWQVLLERLTGGPVTLGALCEGREYDRMEEAVGLYGRYVPVAAAAGRSLHDRAAALEKALTAAREWQDYFAWDEPEAGEPRFFPFCFELAKLPPARSAGGIEVRVTGLEVYLDRFKIRLSCLATAEGLRVEIAYDSARYTAAAAANLAEQLRTLAEGALLTPDAAVEGLPLLSPAARRQLLFGFNQPLALEAPAVAGVHELFARQAVATPQSIALEHGERTLTYAEVDARAGRLASRLRAAGVGAEVVVGLFLERSLELVISVLAVLRAGGAYLPLDPALPRERLAFMVEDSGAGLILTCRALAASVPPGAARILSLDEEELPAALEAPPPAPLSDQLAYVIYTSGSTGRPKGTLISHRALLNYLGWAARVYVGGDEDGEGAPLHSPLSFDLTVTSLFVPLLIGQRVILVPEALGVDGLAAELRRPRDHSFVKLTPAHLEVLRQQEGSGTAGRRCRALVVGGEALLASHVDGWLQRGAATRVFNEYGPTEATVGCCVYEVPAAVGAVLPMALPIGRPISGMRLHVVDEGLEPVPLGVTGELVIGGLGLARGYLGRPDLTAERFVPDPHATAPGERLYQTGDLARYQPGGDLELLGRRDHQVKLHGYRIELGEIEAVLQQHPAVREAVVLVEEEEAGHPRLCACFSAQPPAPGAVELAAWLERKLPAYMVPHAWVGLDTLPLNANGKVDRAALRELARRRDSTQRPPYQPPATDAERILAGIWEELLGVERVGRDDNFLWLGGDSISSLQIIGRASRRGLRLTARQVFDHPRLAELAAVAGVAAGAVSEQGPVAGPAPLLPIQQAFLAVPDPAPHHYVLDLFLELRQPLSAARLARAAETLWHHHDALRLSFRRDGDGWRQEISDPSAPAPFGVVDLAALPPGARDAALAACAEQLAAGFDLAGLLARWALFELGAAGSRLLFLVHHLAADAVSLGILREDLETACRQAGLPPKTTSFRAWAARLREHADSVLLRAELGHWLAPRRREAVPLPLDGTPGSRTVEQSAVHLQELDAASTQALLRDLPRAYRMGTDGALLAALGLTLTRWSGGRVLVDLEGHGREDLFEGVDLTRTVGWFTSLHPLLLDLPADSGPRQALIVVKEELRRPPHRGLGYGLLRHLCSDPAVRQALAAMPAAEVSFNYLGQTGLGVTPEGALFTPAAEEAGTPQGLLRARPWLLEINAFVAAGRLRVEWRYDREAHRPETIEAVAGRFMTELRGLAAHGRSPGAGALTPADFPLARLDASRLDALTAVYGEIQDLYPLAPMQESMLLHSLSFPASDVGFEQTVLQLHGGVDVPALRGAWRWLVARHPALRTGFAWEGGEAALQVVLPEVELPWTEVDLTGLPPAERQERYGGLLAADRERGFDLARPPLLRFLLVRYGEGDDRLVWSRHHALLDGWSTALLLGELDTACEALRRGAEPDLPPCRPYRDYIAWLAGQDPARTAEHWRRLLAGFAAPTPLVVERSAPREAAEPRWGGRRRNLPAAFSARLREVAARHGLTANVLLQGAWAFLLSRYSGEPDVVFGSTVAGRPGDLPGVEEMVGLFIRNLPVRLRCAPEAGALEALRTLQQEQLTMREHEAASPADVQPWSEVPGSLPLFESLVVFENYPVADPSLEDWDGGSEEESAAAVRTAYPLTLVAARPEQLVLLLVYDGDRFEGTAVRRMMGHLESLLAGLAEEPARPVGALPLLATAERHQLLVEWEGGPVLDSLGQPVPLGVEGEIRRGTGERGRHRADGAVERLGRCDDLVRVQGRRVNLGRLEAVLASHPGVAAAAVVVRGERLLAYVEPASGVELEAGDLRGFLRRSWSTAPQPAEIVLLAALPREAGGAVDREAVDPEALPSPESARLAADLAAELLGTGRDLVEEQLARLWEDVLGLRPIGLDDDFFALGGTSVAALRLASRVRQELGRDLPLATFYSAATVRGLAQRLGAATAAAWSPLVPIRPAGGRQPFFCVHPVGGNVLCFVDLARHLDPGRPFYALQAAGLGGGRAPHTRLEDMAAHYLAEIRRVQPRGPYRLGGLSFGGYVAFEMARQLAVQGERVALLALLDTASPLYRGQRTFQADAATVLAVQAGFMAQAGGAELEIDPAELRRLDPAACLDAVVARLLAAGSSQGLGAEHLRRLLAVYQDHAVCLERYEPQPYAGPLTIFRAREELRELADVLEHPAQHEPDYGWSELSAGPVEVRMVPGNHSTMVYEPQVPGLAAELDAALARADALAAEEEMVHV